ncbi:hypothetical protein HDU91_002871, partial [Kappamyces sp. JEL0680]
MFKSKNPNSIDSVLALTKPTPEFLCGDMGYQFFTFMEFTVVSLDDNKVVFSVKRPDGIPHSWEEGSPEQGGMESRTAVYSFPASFLDCKQIKTSLSFAVGPKEIKNLRMIERHYFKDRLLRSYDFTFGFCIPNTVNNWETLYE